jgi:hypothetical protein
MIIGSSKPSAGRAARDGGSAMDSAWRAEVGQDVSSLPRGLAYKQR